MQLNFTKIKYSPLLFALLIHLDIPPTFFKEVCPQPIWSKTIVLDPVKDNREAALIGDQEKKGKETIFVESDKPLTTVFEAALTTLLTTCGVSIVPADATTPTLSVSIENFYAGVEKKSLTGKAAATSKLTFLENTSNTTTAAVEMGIEMESKRVKRKNIRQLTDVLNQLLKATLAQIPKTKQVQELFK